MGTAKHDEIEVWVRRAIDVVIGRLQLLPGNPNGLHRLLAAQCNLEGGCLRRHADNVVHLDATRGGRGGAKVLRLFQIRPMLEARENR